MKVTPVSSVISNETTPFQGILHHVYFKSNNSFLKLLGNLTLSSSSYGGPGSIYSIVGVNNENFNTFFQTQNQENSWIEFEFTGITVSVNKYEYRAAEHDFQTKWQLQGSNDNITWDLIDEQTTTSYPSSNFVVTKSFTCNQGNKNRYSFLRILSLGERGPSFNFKYILPIYGFELYGNIFSYVSFTYTRVHFPLRSSTLLIYFLM